VFSAVLAACPGLARADGCKLEMYAQLPVTMEGYRASVPVRINNHPTSFWLDSGAFFSTMSRAKAAELELAVKPFPAEEFKIVGVGGSANADFTTVRSFGFAKADLKNVDFIVGGSDMGNAVIGANILASRDAEFDLADGVVKLGDARDCRKANLAYWAPGKPFFTVALDDDPAGSNLHRFRFPVTINGVRIDAEFDTGAPYSLLSRRAALLAGIDLKGKSAVPIPGLGGFGSHIIRGWAVPVENVGVGDEHVLHTRIDVIDGPIASGETAPDMLVGADFALAHHLYVARRLHLIFFTYSGGRPFIAEAPAPHDASAASPASAAMPTGMHAVTALGDTAEPTTADGYARRAGVHLAQRAFADAIADYTAAIRLAPGEAAYYHDRARAYGESGALVLAKTDIDKAISLDPQNGDLLLTRASLRLHEHDRPGALADVESAVKVTPPNSLKTGRIAELLTELGQPGRAITLLGPVIDMHGDDAQLGPLLNARCWARALANTELDRALDDCNRAVKRFGPNPGILDSRGLVRYRKGDLAGAIADYDAALKVNPKLAWSLLMRGAAKAKQGDAAGGKADQDAAKALRPAIADDAARNGLP
jgi:tetratricopeptide (TPR) repeat protein/predicted aspartyl protease